MLTNGEGLCIIQLVAEMQRYEMALWCSRLARQPVTLEVDGSSPFGVAKFRPGLGSGLKYASVAQLVEQRIENPRVVGSTPTGGTMRA